MSRSGASGVSFRLATVDDVVPYARAAERFFRATYGYDPHHAGIMDAHCTETYDERVIEAQLRDPLVQVIMAEASGAIVGFAHLRQVSGARTELLRFYLDVDWQGRGLAARLMEETRRVARTGGARTLFLGVWTDNSRAIAFYTRQGFVATGQVPFLLAGEAQSDLLMQYDF
jgi:diamine N-acetyltransferase